MKIYKRYLKLDGYSYIYDYLKNDNRYITFMFGGGYSFFRDPTNNDSYGNGDGRGGGDESNFGHRDGDGYGDTYSSNGQYGIIEEINLFDNGTKRT